MMNEEEPGIIARIRAGERIEHYETVRRRKDGALIDISLTVLPIHAPDGTIIGASKIAREITDLKRAQNLLNLSEARYQSLFNSLDDGFCVIQVLFDEQGQAFDYRFIEISPGFTLGSLLVAGSEDGTGRQKYP